MNKRQIVKILRDDIWENCGEKISVSAAEVDLDWMCEAFYQRWMGAGPAYAVASDPLVAQYLRDCAWKGDDRKRLAEAIATYEAARA
jgi:hypothetical protein